MIKLILLTLITFNTIAETMTIELPPGEYRLEKDYQKAGCHGQIEFRLPDKTRVDCLTATHAIEYDFGAKWAESIGQSLYYSFQTGKKAGVVLIYKKPSDARYYHRLMSVIQHNKLPIDVWIIENKYMVTASSR